MWAFYLDGLTLESAFLMSPPMLPRRQNTGQDLWLSLGLVSVRSGCGFHVSFSWGSLGGKEQRLPQANLV